MIETWLADMQAGSRRALSRLLTQVENDPEAARQIGTAVHPQTGKAHIIGITGPPGSGKSSLVTELAKTFRQMEQSVAIVAVDPSSPFSGGALLGDRVRMNELSGDKGVFIRSLASRGSLGGLARATTDVTKLLDAAGFDLILVETVGAGQAEVEIANMAHTTLVIEAPGMGDGVQSIKAGILEIADILVVNKADKPEAHKTLNHLKSMLHQGPAGGTRHHGRILKTIQPDAQDDAIWQTPVLPTSATKGDGITELAEAITAHRTHLQQSGQWQQREQLRTRQEMMQLLQTRFLDYLQERLPAEQLEAQITAVTNREQDVYTAVDNLFEKIVNRN